MTDAAVVGPLVSASMLLAGWLLAGTRDDRRQPRRMFVTLGQWTAMAGALVGLLTFPPHVGYARYIVGFALFLIVSMALVRGAGRNAVGWTSSAEIITAAFGAGWKTPRRSVWSLVALSAGVCLSAWLASQGWSSAGLLGALIALSPVRWWLRLGWTRERTVTGIERALAGLHLGGEEWDTHSAALRGAPVEVKFRADGTPDLVVYPLPPSWRASEEEKLEADLRARLEKWGYWLVQVNTSERIAIAHNVDPLPEILLYDGEVATDRGELTLGLARLSRKAAKSKHRRYGEVIGFRWDARISPHGLVVGATGGGKSSVFRVIITAWARHPNKRVVLLDPKTTEFTLFQGRRNILTVADTVESMTVALQEVESERRRRAALCKSYGVTAVWRLPEDMQPPSWLIVIDEIMDYLDKNQAGTEEAKAENELRAQAQGLINRIDQLARVGDIHMLLAGQRLDRKVVDGRIQNNSPLRVLTGVAEAGTTERHMIDLAEVEPEIVTDGRGVARSVKFPESEVQFTYLDEDDLDRWLPINSDAVNEWAAITDTAPGPDPNHAAQTPERAENRDALDALAPPISSPSESNTGVESYRTAELSFDPFEVFDEGG